MTRVSFVTVGATGITTSNLSVSDVNRVGFSVAERRVGRGALTCANAVESRRSEPMIATTEDPLRFIMAASCLRVATYHSTPERTRKNTLYCSDRRRLCY